MDRPTPAKGLKKFAAVITVSIALTGAGVLSAAPAVAANHCTTNYVCLYDYDNYTGLLTSRFHGAATIFNLLPEWADKAASWGNDGSYDAGLWDEPYASGACWELPTKSSGWFGTFDRDRAESWRTVNGC